MSHVHAIDVNQLSSPPTNNLESAHTGFCMGIIKCEYLPYLYTTDSKIGRYFKIAVGILEIVGAWVLALGLVVALFVGGCAGVYFGFRGCCWAWCRGARAVREHRRGTYKKTVEMEAFGGNES